MKNRKDGGPAFPMEYEHEGMSLRDYFASKAPFPPPFEKQSYFQNMLINDTSGGQKLENTLVFEDTHEWYSRWAYQFADAMLEARSK